MFAKTAFNFPLFMTLACSGTAASPTAPSKMEAVAEAPPAVASVSRVALDDLQEGFKGAVGKAGPAVVSIYTTRAAAPRGFLHLRGLQPPGPHGGLGSGFIVDDAGHVVTNNHVVEGAEDIRVRLSDGREFEARIQGRDPSTDLAVLRIEDPKDLPRPLELVDDAEVEVGDWVLAIGSPFGLSRTVSSGIVSATGRGNVGVTDYENFIQTDAAVNPGNSGGPLVDLDGRVVGVNTAIASRTGGNHGVAFAVPSHLAAMVVDQLIDEGSVTRAQLGIIISEASPELAQSFGFQKRRAVLVQDLAEDSPAARAGVRSGDIIVELDGKAVESVAQFRGDVAHRRPGEEVRLGLWRDGEEQTLAVVLEASDRNAVKDRDGAKRKEFGIQLRDLEVNERKLLELDAAQGVYVAGVKPGSSAARAGLRAGDVVLRINGEKVATAKQLVKKLKAVEGGEGVRLRVQRDGMGHFLFLRAPGDE